MTRYLKIFIPLFLLSGIPIAQAQMTEVRENAEESQKELSNETGTPEAPPALSEPEETEEASEITEAQDVTTPPPPPAEPQPSPAKVRVNKTETRAKTVTLLPSKPQAPEPENQRSKWYIGFSLGGGNGQIGLAEGDQFTHRKYLGLSKDRSVGAISMEFEVGGTINQQLLLGFHWGFFATGADEARTDAGTFPGRSVAQSQALAMLTYFPMLDGQGLFLRTGLGFSSLEDVTTQKDEDTIKHTYSGFGSCVGAGYAFWLGETFNLTVHSNVHFSLFDGDGPSSSFSTTNEPTSGWYGNLMLGFMWY